jgi:flagellar biosynthesis/type III secretory pathway protein FliH
MQNRKVKQSVPAPESDLVSMWRELLAAAKGGEQLRNPPSNVDLGISEMLDHQPKNKSSYDHGPKRSEDSSQSTYEAGLASGREAGYQQGYREGFWDGCNLRNPVQEMAATPDKSTVGSKKTRAKSMTRLRGLPCANCGRSTYSDELECPGCGTPKARNQREACKK